MPQGKPKYPSLPPPKFFFFVFTRTVKARQLRNMHRKCSFIFEWQTTSQVFILSTWFPEVQNTNRLQRLMG